MIVEWLLIDLMLLWNRWLLWKPPRFTLMVLCTFCRLACILLWSMRLGRFTTCLLTWWYIFNWLGRRYLVLLLLRDRIAPVEVVDKRHASERDRRDTSLKLWLLNVVACLLIAPWRWHIGRVRWEPCKHGHRIRRISTRRKTSLSSYLTRLRHHSKWRLTHILVEHHLIILRLLQNLSQNLLLLKMKLL